MIRSGVHQALDAWGEHRGHRGVTQWEVGTIVSAERDKERSPMEHGSLASQTPAQTQAPPSPPAQSLEADVQAHLGRQLRAVYDEMASQPVPDRFIQLLDALERRQRPAAAGGADGAPAHATPVHADQVKAGDA
jgi:hypothetical protein